MIRMRSRWTAAVLAGAALGAAGVVVADSATETAEAQSGFTVTPEQLQINQRISSAAVRRSNQALNYLAPIRTNASDNADDGTNGVKNGTGTGWTSGQIANGAITRAKIAGGLLPYWAVVDGNGALIRSQGATSSSKLSTGVYLVTFTPAVNNCSYQVSLASPNNQPPAAPANGQISVYAPSNNALQVQTFGGGGGSQDRPFHVAVSC